MLIIRWNKDKDFKYSNIAEELTILIQKLYDMSVLWPEGSLHVNNDSFMSKPWQDWQTIS